MIGQFCGRVLRESGNRGTPGILTQAIGTQRRPVEDRLAGACGRTYSRRYGLLVELHLQALLWAAT